MAENEKQTNKERLKDITDSIERGIQDLFQSDKEASDLRLFLRQKPLNFRLLSQKSDLFRVS